MTHVQALILLVAASLIFAATHFGALDLLRKGFRWIADTIDRLCGLDTSGH